MKNLLLISYLFITCMFAGCNSDDDNQSLPPETQTGANTVGCLVNGEVFLPHAGGLSPEVNCFYQLVDGEYYFSMSFSDRRGTSNEAVNIFTAKIQLATGETYTLNEPDTPEEGAGGEYRTSSSNQYNTNNIQTGELTITRIDLSNSIVSGTFWFDAINEDGEIVEVREGRFDWNY